MEKRNRSQSRSKSVIILLLFLTAAVLSAICMGKVKINYDLADYLGNDTQTKIALDILDKEFGSTGNLQVLAKNVSPDLAEEISEKIKAVPYVQNVRFDRYDETYYKNQNALFLVFIDGNDYSDHAKQVVAEVQSALASYDGVEYGGTTIEKQALQDAITSEMGYILAISLCLVLAILLITSESWLEPPVLLFASGIAVLLNRGTNVFFGEISYITNSIAAILQLALSIDYSIVLLHAYRREKDRTPDNIAAMHAAVKAVVKPVSASALTTLAGLLALLFMSFRIGFDIGMVLMKGIVLSAITSLTLLPALILLLDHPMKKKAFVPKGKAFCKIAYKAGKGIVPIALALVLVCGTLQTQNQFLFTDTKTGNKEISEIFGNNNCVVVVYPNTKNHFATEADLSDALLAYRTKDGKPVLSGYTAYTNTVRASYDVQKIVQELQLSQKDAQLLLAMYHLYHAPTDTRMTFAEFVSFSHHLLETDADVREFMDADTVKTLQTLYTVCEVLEEELIAEELYAKWTTGVMAETDLSLFSVKQLYGLYFYDQVPEKEVSFRIMLPFLLAASENENLTGVFDRATVEQLQLLAETVTQFTAQMELPMDKASLNGWFYQNTGASLSEAQLAQIYTGYFAATGEPEKDTIPFLSLLKFLCASGQIQDPDQIHAVAEYDSLYTAICAKYDDTQFLPALAQIATAFSGQPAQISASAEEIQQIYLLYFMQIQTLPNGKLTGRKFAEYARTVDQNNSVVHGQLTEKNRQKLTDLCTISSYVADSASLTYEDAYQKFSALQKELQSDLTLPAIDRDKISGVYLKYALSGNPTTSTAPVLACDLLDFIRENMDKNTLLQQKMNADNRKKVADATAEMQKATDLFLGDSYSRMLLSVDLQNESTDTTEFVEFLSAKVKDLFGEGAYIAGEIVSTYDLEKSFDHDNRFITLFTLISIFVIVMLTFKSFSLPIILVAIIQGAIFIAMSTQLGNDIFFMSYIVSTCILMGATIDYGILMSSNYVSYRSQYDKKTALALSVDAAMPTVFTSGLILTVCGFIISFLSSQNSISTVGLLIGIGTICSVMMITIVLPSMLYLLDTFVLKLSRKKH